jgi:hypothetical protein
LQAEQPPLPLHLLNNEDRYGGRDLSAASDASLTIRHMDSDQRQYEYRAPHRVNLLVSKLSVFSRLLTVALAYTSVKIKTPTDRQSGMVAFHRRISMSERDLSDSDCYVEKEFEPCPKLFLQTSCEQSRSPPFSLVTRL